MAQSLIVNGVTYAYPTSRDEDWAADASGWAVAITVGTLQKAGGLFTLLDEVDFGASFGLKSLYYTSRSADPASAGQVRFARSDVISFRNEANNTNLDLGVNSSNKIVFNGSVIDGGLSNIVEDTTPELGGNLDGGGFNITNVADVLSTATVSGVTFKSQSAIIDYNTNLNPSDFRDASLLVAAENKDSRFGIGITITGAVNRNQYLRFFKSRGTVEAREAIQPGDTIGIVEGQGWDGDRFIGNSFIAFGVDNLPVADDQIPGILRFGTKSPEAGKVLTDWMWITASGQVGIGQLPSQSPGLEIQPNSKLTVHGTTSGTNLIIGEGIEADSVAAGTSLTVSGIPVRIDPAGIGTGVDDVNSVTNSVVVAGTGEVAVTTTGQTITISGTTVTPRGHLWGMELSNGGDADHDIDVSAGICRDSTDSVNIQLGASFTKKLDNLGGPNGWVAGDGDDGRPVGVDFTADTWYHVFVIYKTAGSLTDTGFDTDIDATNLLADSGYDFARRLGSVLTDGSVNILEFKQSGDEVQFKVPIRDVDDDNPGTNSVQSTLSTPTGIRMLAHLTIGLYDSNSTAIAMFIHAGDGSTALSSISTTSPAEIIVGVGGGGGGGGIDWNHIGGVFLTDLASRVRYELDVSTVTTTVTIVTHGYTDHRGRLS